MLRAVQQVMGAHFRSIGKRDAVNQTEQWIQSLDKLHKAERLGTGHEQLFHRLRISFDELGSSEKQVFLDAACFFLGWRADTVKRAWRRCAVVDQFLGVWQHIAIGMLLHCL